MKPRQKKALVRRILRAKEKAKALYSTIDELSEMLIASVPVGEVIEVAEGRFHIVNSFARSNVAWGHGSVRLYDLQKVPTLPSRPKAAPVEGECAAVNQ